MKLSLKGVWHLQELYAIPDCYRSGNDSLPAHRRPFCLTRLADLSPSRFDRN